MKKLALLNLALVLSLLLGTAAWAADDILGAANGYFSGGTKHITAADLFDNLNDGDPTNDPYIISVRTQENYDKGHVPGAVWMDAKTLFTAGNLDTLPTDEQIVVYCDSGQVSSQIVSALNMLGFDAWSMKYGFCAWNSDPNAGSLCFDGATHGSDYPTTTDPTAVVMMAYPPAVPLADTTQAAADAYFSGGAKNMLASDLFDNLNDGDPSNDPFIISLRSPEDYEIGHIPMAVNMDYRTMFTEGGMIAVPDNIPLVVYCYTGQDASAVVSALNILGYDATNLKWGMQGWTMDNNVRVKYFNPETDLNEFPFEGTAAEAAEPAEPAEPVALPMTGGVAVPVQGLLMGFGTLTAAAGLYLRWRKAA